MKCFQGPVTQPTFGPDNLFVIPNGTITSASQSLPTAISAPCVEMAVESYSVSSVIG